MRLPVLAAVCVSIVLAASPSRAADCPDCVTVKAGTTPLSTILASWESALESAIGSNVLVSPGSPADCAALRTLLAQWETALDAAAGSNILVPPTSAVDCNSTVALLATWRSALHGAYGMILAAPPTAADCRPVCRPATGACDVAETCTGSSTTCPADVFKPNGDPCPTGSCSAGMCVAPADAGTDAPTDTSTADADALVDSDVDAEPDTEDTNVTEDTSVSEDTAAVIDAADAAPSPAAPVEDDSGCGCRVNARGDAASAAWIAVAALVIAARTTRSRIRGAR